MPVFNPHEIIPPAYKGREQAYIKHLLLEGYLERLLYIIGWNANQLRHSEIIFVDCFAGPWQDESSDLSSTSIAISLRLLSKIHRNLGRIGRHVKFRAIYVERDPAAFARLRHYLTSSSPPNVPTEAIQGDFSEKIPGILERCAGDSFVFFFIDPKGWLKVQPNILHGLLTRPRSEFLINFMYNFVNRTVSMAGLQEKMSGLFDSAVDFSQLPEDPDERERHILQLYRSAVVSRAHTSKHQALSGYVTILDPTIDRTKYHLIYLTRHPLGIIEFMTQSEKMAAIQTTVRAAAKINKKNKSAGMDDLFGVDADQTGEDRNLDIKRVENYWLELIGEDVLTVTEEVFAKALCDTNCFPSELQTAAKNLMDRGRVTNLDAGTSRRTKNFVNYEKNERLKRA
jgi:three-Cys-motif partner protein